MLPITWRWVFFFCYVHHPTVLSSLLFSYFLLPSRFSSPLRFSIPIFFMLACAECLWLSACVNNFFISFLEVFFFHQVRRFLSWWKIDFRIIFFILYFIIKKSWRFKNFLIFFKQVIFLLICRFNILYPWIMYTMINLLMNE